MLIFNPKDRIKAKKLLKILNDSEVIKSMATPK